MNSIATPKSRMIAFITCWIGMSSCTTEQQFPNIGTAFSGPIDIASDGELLHVLNSDFDRRYNQGSIIAINPETEEKVVTEVSRMGRSLYIQGTKMLVTYDKTELEGEGKVEVMTLNPEVPGTFTSNGLQDIDCSPINGILSPSGNYGVVSCLAGEICRRPERRHGRI